MSVGSLGMSLSTRVFLVFPLLCSVTSQSADGEYPVSVGGLDFSQTIDGVSPVSVGRLGMSLFCMGVPQSADGEYPVSVGSLGISLSTRVCLGIPVLVWVSPNLPTVGVC